MEETYDGVPLADLPIDAIDWFYRAEHLRTRSARHPGDLAPEWATEAALDPTRRVLLDKASQSGEGTRVIGSSPSADRVVTVVVVPKHHPPTGAGWGATAWVTNDTDRYYEERI